MTLVPRFLLGDLDLTEYPFATMFGGSSGAPANVSEVIDSMLQDGEIISSTRTSNREMSYSVLIEEADMEALAQAEARLIAEADKRRNTFSIDPGDGFGAVTVFEIFRVQVEFVRDEEWEQAGFRRYDLTFPALPFGRADKEVVNAALTSAVTPVSAVIADGTSAANWSGDSAITSVGGTLQQTRPAAHSTASDGDYYSASGRFTYTPAAAIDFSATQYLTVDYLYASNLYRGPAITATVDGSPLPLVAEVTPPAGGAWRRATFLCTDASAAVIRFDVSATIFRPVGSGGAVPTITFQVDNVQRSNQAPNASTTGRESLRTVAVSGSARTQASLAIQHATTGLGDTLVYTCPALGSGYQPDLRRWRTTAATVTADATTVSGSYEPITSAVTFNVPAAGLPKGSYVLMARVRSDAAGGAATRGVKWSASTKIGAATFGQQSGTSAKFPLTTTAWNIVPVGVMTLPPTDVTPGSTATVEVNLLDAGTGDRVTVDEAWLFYLGDDSALTQVACGAGTPALGTVHNRLWLDTASIERYEPSIWQGTQVDRSDSFHAGDGIPAWGIHSFAPPRMNVFVVTTGGANPEISLRHFPRYHTHALAS